MSYNILKDNGLIMEVLVGETDLGVKESTADGKLEKHVPFIEEIENGYIVKVGEEQAHPMTEEHYINFIELIIDGNRVYRHHLTPSDKPETTFIVEKGTHVIAREYCNLHGLWKSEK